jgi:metal-sulfur cluster biosynthetic enzyme
MASEHVESEIRRALAQVIDPETGLSIMRMDLVHDIEVSDDGALSLVFRPSSPVCPMAYVLANSIKKALEAIKQVTSVTIRVENFERADHLESVLASEQ